MSFSICPKFQRKSWDFLADTRKTKIWNFQASPSQRVRAKVWIPWRSEAFKVQELKRRELVKNFVATESQSLKITLYLMTIFGALRRNFFRRPRLVAISVASQPSPSQLIFAGFCLSWQIAQHCLVFDSRSFLSRWSGFSTRSKSHFRRKK